MGRATAYILELGCLSPLDGGNPKSDKKTIVLGQVLFLRLDKKSERRVTRSSNSRPFLFGLNTDSN